MSQQQLINLLITVALGLITILLFISCAQPRYDSQGNGTRFGDRLERWAIKVVNQEQNCE